MLSVCTVTAGSAYAIDPTSPEILRGMMESAKSAALSYISGENFGFVGTSLSEYARLARELSDMGELQPYYADTAEALCDAYDYSPELYAVTGERKVFMGSDGYFAPGADAVRLNVTLDLAPVSDYLHLIPKTAEELCILVALDTPSERSMIDIAAGKKDDVLLRELRTVSRLEGQLYLTFCPGINLKNDSRTLHMSYIAAFRRIADMARRYAPNVSMVYSVGDRLDAGDDTVAKFYPGDPYVDVLGVEFIHGSESLNVSEERMAWELRDRYYDPVYSVCRIADTFKNVTGRDIPLMVTGCSFPWQGYNARDDWAFAMEEFYTVLPRLRGDLTAIFYGNTSNSFGVCNLRQNRTAAELYEKCISQSSVSAVPLASLSKIGIDGTAKVFPFTRRLFGTEAYDVYLDGNPTDGTVNFAEGEHTLEVYLYGSVFYSKLSYALSVKKNGTFAIELVSPEFDYNGNGILDFGDSELLSAYIAKWQVDLGGFSPDVNGDGLTNIRDISALEMLMMP